MKNKLLIGMILSLAAATNFGCGGGGGSSAAPDVPQNFTITGTAVDGPLNGATINVFKLNSNGTPGEKIAGPITTTEVGTFSAPIGPNVGPVMVEATGGTFDDPATGATGVPLTGSMRAAVNITGDVKIAVTPLSELAFREVVKEGAKNAPRPMVLVVNDANALVGTLFNISDIIKTTPADNNKPFPLTATDDEKKFGLKLAIISQRLKILKDQNPGKNINLKDVLDELSSGIVNNSFSDDIVTKLTDANAQFNLNPNNKVVTAVAASKATLKFRTTGTLQPGGSIGGIEFTLALPSGVTVAADPTTGQTTATSVSLSGGVPPASAGTMMMAKFTASQAAPAASAKVRTGVANATGFGVGEFATVVCDIAPGTRLTPGDFSINASKVADFNGERITAGGVSTLFDVIFQ